MNNSLVSEQITELGKEKLEIFSQKIEQAFKLKKPAVDALHRLGILTIKDLLFYKPLYVLQRRLYPDISTLKSGDNAILELEVKEIELARFRNRKIPSKIYCENKLNQGITIIYFSPIPQFILKFLKIGSKYIITGKVERYLDYIQITHPEYIFNKELVQEFEPIYPLTYGVSNKQLGQIIRDAIKKIPIVYEWLPQDLIKQLDLISFNEAVRLLHYPAQDINQKAIKRLAVDEIFANQLALALIRKFKQTIPGKSFQKSSHLQEQVLKHLGFDLTDSQQEAILEIEQDQSSHNKMMRILQGDVGSGKTLVALMTMLNVVAADAQAVLMVPTEILARQHYAYFQKALENTNIKVGLLIGKTKQKDKIELIQAACNGELQIVIGTHALFQEQVEFKNLGYIVIDEQHRFGVEQRLELIEKGKEADVLVMSATPIPRSLNLVLFGDMEISKLYSKPKGRPDIITTSINEGRVTELIESLSKILDKGQKIYWVCPLIEREVDNEQPVDNILSTEAVIRHSILEKKYPGRVALIHGKMSTLEKERAMEEFRNGDKNILVATTVIEVGVDVPDATLMIIENAEKFGLSQLHQLRGRVGRGSLQSHCILIYGVRLSNIAKERLKIIKNSGDGFYIAEQDLKLRGGGEIIGTRQSGEQTFIIADFLRDIDLFMPINEKIRKIIANNNSNEQAYWPLLLSVFEYSIYSKFINPN